jgi:hypothetical protein
VTPRRGECKSTSGRVPLQFSFPIKENIGNIFHKFPSQARKTTEIPFSNRRYWHYIPKVPITSQKKTRKSRFQKEFKKKILALFSRQAQNTKEFPFSNEVSHHKQKKTTTEILFSNRRGIIFQKFHHKPKKPREFRFQIEEALFSRGSHHKPRKNTKIPFSNRTLGDHKLVLYAYLPVKYANMQTYGVLGISSLKTYTYWKTDFRQTLWSQTPAQG